MVHLRSTICRTKLTGRHSGATTSLCSLTSVAVALLFRTTPASNPPDQLPGPRTQFPRRCRRETARQTPGRLKRSASSAATHHVLKKANSNTASTPSTSTSDPCSACATEDAIFTDATRQQPLITCILETRRRISPWTDVADYFEVIGPLMTTIRDFEFAATPEEQPSLNTTWDYQTSFRTQGPQEGHRDSPRI